MSKNALEFTGFLLFLLLQIGHSLKCYVCFEQEDNKGKCLKTVKICDYGQDMCLTDVKWGSTRYWEQGPQMQYYVSKSCSNRTYCEQLRRTYLPYCERIWYEDWKCMDCCQGDLCNYYVTLTSSHLYYNPLLLWVTVGLGLLLTL